MASPTAAKTTNSCTHFQAYRGFSFIAKYHEGISELLPDTKKVGDRVMIRLLASKYQPVNRTTVN